MNKEAKRKFDEADRLVKQGRYDEVRVVDLLPSDRAVIEARIVEHQRRAKNLTFGRFA